MSVMVEKGEAARALRSEGLLYREIAERLDISVSYVEQLINDPDGSKVRARKMQGTCEDCGRAIYSDGPSRSPQRRCEPCQRAYVHEHRKWTPETIVAAIRRWAELYGSAPSASAWNTSHARPQDLERFRAGDYPPVSAVMGEFDGSFGKALVAAGFQPRHPNALKRRNSVPEDELAEMARMRALGLTNQEIADWLGIKIGAVAQRFRRMKEGGHMSTTLKAETVLEREIQRFEDRKARAEAEVKDAALQVKRLKVALAALTNGRPKP